MVWEWVGSLSASLLSGVNYHTEELTDAAIIGIGGLRLVPSHGTCLGDLADRVVGTAESPGLPYTKEQEVRAVLRRRST